MIKLIRDLSIRNKLLSILIFSSGSGLVLAAFILLVFEVTEFKQNVLDDLSAMAEIVGNRSSAALLFDDPELAKENLKALTQLPIFHAACIYDKNGKVIAFIKVKAHLKDV